MAIEQGSDLRIYDNDVPIGYATTCTFSGSTSMTEVIHKDSVGNFSDKSPSTQSWTMTTEAFVSQDATINGSSRRNAVYLRTAWKNRTKLYLQWSTGSSGDGTMYGYAYISQYDENAAANEDATLSVTFEGTGAISIGTET